MKTERVWEKGKTYTFRNGWITKSVMTYHGVNDEGSPEFEHENRFRYPLAFIDKVGQLLDGNEAQGYRFALELGEEGVFKDMRGIGRGDTGFTPLEVIAKEGEPDHKVKVNVDYIN